MGRALVSQPSQQKVSPYLSRCKSLVESSVTMVKKVLGNVLKLISLLLGNYSRPQEGGFELQRFCSLSRRRTRGPSQPPLLKAGRIPILAKHFPGIVWLNP